MKNFEILKALLNYLKTIQRINKTKFNNLKTHLLVSVHKRIK